MHQKKKKIVYNTDEKKVEKMGKSMLLPYFDEYVKLLFSTKAFLHILSWKVMNIEGKKKRYSSFSSSDLLMRETHSRCD